MVYANAMTFFLSNYRGQLILSKQMFIAIAEDKLRRQRACRNRLPIGAAYSTSCRFHENKRLAGADVAVVFKHAIS
jgi:hypothetical protein